MPGITKYGPINNATLISHFKSYIRTKRTVGLAYAFIFIVFAFTIFLAFTPSSSPWFTNTFTVTSASSTTNPITSSSIFSGNSYGSHFSSIFYYFHPNSSSSSSSQSHQPGSQHSVFFPSHLETESPVLENNALNDEIAHKDEVLKQKNGTMSSQRPSLNQTVNNNNNPPNISSDFSKGSSDINNKTQNKKLNGKSKFPAKVEVLKANKTVKSSPSSVKNVTANVIIENGAVKNLTSEQGKQSNGTDIAKVKQGTDDLMNCDMYDGDWVRDETYPLYNPGSCSLIDEQFDCFRNGRPDHSYLKLKWKPKGCTLPRLNGSHMLELLRGKRLVFVGDSLNRNMWESLLCILKNSVKDQKKVYEENGASSFRNEPSYSFIFEDYNCTVEFFVSTFLVQEWKFKVKNGTTKETLRLDLVGKSADKYKNADVIVFNTGHWWTHEKTSKGESYYQEGSHVYSQLDVDEAFRKAITTWGRWIDANVNPMKSFVFFRGYSASHFSGGQWNSGGACHNETRPIKNDTYLEEYPTKMTVLERVLRGMKTKVTYLNVTTMTDYRKDGHPSIYRTQVTQHLSDEERRSPLSFQDCSHWCLPGVPDAWNEILYSELLVKLNQKQQSHKGP